MKNIKLSVPCYTANGIKSVNENFTAKGVISDLDGTMIDTSSVQNSAMKKLYKNFAVMPAETDTQEFYARYKVLMQDKNFKGNALDAFAIFFQEKYLKHQSAGNVSKVAKDIYCDTLREKAIYKDGAVEFIKSVREKGIPTALATSSDQAMLSALHKNTKLNEVAKLTDLFDIIGTLEDVKNPKPAPDIYFNVTQKMELEPLHCLGLEDTLSGVQAVRGAGLRAVGVFDAGALKDKAEIIKLTPHYVDKMTDIEIIQ